MLKKKSRYIIGNYFILSTFINRSPRNKRLVQIIRISCHREYCKIQLCSFFKNIQKFFCLQ